MEVRAAVNNTTIQNSFSPRSHFYAPQIHKKPDLIHSTAHTTICLILAEGPLHSSVKKIRVKSPLSLQPAKNLVPDVFKFDLSFGSEDHVILVYEIKAPQMV